MIKTCWFDADGNLINIGDWDDQDQTNPLPDGSYSEEREVAEDDDGGLYVTDLPRPPSLAEQVKQLQGIINAMMMG